MLRYRAETDNRPIWPRNPWPNSPRPLSHYVENEPAEILPGTQKPTQWTPFGTFVPQPYLKGMPASLMAVAQDTLYDASPNAWPNNGQWDRPNGYFAALMRLKPHTSAHPGKSNPTGGGPTMYFHAPPVFSMQTKPIPAVGI